MIQIYVLGTLLFTKIILYELHLLLKIMIRYYIAYIMVILNLPILIQNKLNYMIKMF